MLAPQPALQLSPLGVLPLRRPVTDHGAPVDDFVAGLALVDCWSKDGVPSAMETITAIDIHSLLHRCCREIAYRGTGGLLDAWGVDPEALGYGLELAHVAEQTREDVEFGVLLGLHLAEALRVAEKFEGYFEPSGDVRFFLTHGVRPGVGYLYVVPAELANELESYIASDEDLLERVSEDTAYALRQYWDLGHGATFDDWVRERLETLTARLTEERLRNCGVTEPGAAVAAARAILAGQPVDEDILERLKSYEAEYGYPSVAPAGASEIVRRSTERARWDARHSRSSRYQRLVSAVEDAPSIAYRCERSTYVTAAAGRDRSRGRCVPRITPFGCTSIAGPLRSKTQSAARIVRCQAPESRRSYMCSIARDTSQSTSAGGVVFAIAT